MINPSQVVESMSAKKQFIWEFRVNAIEMIATDFDVSKLTDFQFRINGKIDLYVMKCRYHDLRNNQRGEYPDSPKGLAEFLSKRLNVVIDLKLYETKK